MSTSLKSQKLVFVVEDEETVSKLLEFWLTKRWGYTAKLFANGEACLDSLDEQPDLVLLDVMMPGIGGVETLKEIKRRDPELPVIMLSAQSNVETAINTLKLGAYDYFSKPIDFPKLEAAVKSALRLREVTLELQRLRERVDQPVQFDQIVAASGEMREVFKLVHKIKDNDIPVLILGESGTGKELIARAIHDNGHRKSGPFVVVNCASIPHDLLESELFGHERGAFTGAIQRRIGRFEAARGGTIFLDEIGELDISLQAKLLRVIQTKRFERVGGNETIETDARLISATNRDLREEVKQKRFREDLYFRLAAFPIVLPPLRQRKSDILLLAEHFLKKFSRELSKPPRKLSRSAAQLLYEYPWPGNVRELENTLQRAVVMAEGDEITEHDLPLTFQSFTQQKEKDFTGLFAPGSEIIPMEKLREEAIRHALKVTGGNIAEAAAKLKIGRATFYRLLKKYKITA
jgi:two-component system response regulator AtoC